MGRSLFYGMDPREVCARRLGPCADAAAEALQCRACFAQRREPPLPRPIVQLRCETIGVEMIDLSLEGTGQVQRPSLGRQLSNPPR